MFVFPHGVIIDDDDNVWIVDAGVAEGKGNQIFKFSPEGEVLMTIGEAGVRGETEALLNEPLDLAIAPNGDIYVADGHFAQESNGRIVRFDRNGRFISAWGTKGDGPSQLDCPHPIALDSQG
jgi:sugar lactone lactonase YvrE